MVVLCLGQLMLTLDATVANVALPAIQRDLQFSQSSLAWVVNGYLITFGGALLLAGRLGDLLGRRNVFLAGLALFTFASLLCGLATSQGLLIGARGLQGRGRGGRLRDDPGHPGHPLRRSTGHGEGGGHLHLRRGERRDDRAACRRRTDPGAQLALDLLHQSPDRRCHAGARRAAHPRPPGHRPPPRHRRPGRAVCHRDAGTGRLYDHPGERQRVGLDPHPRPGRRRARHGACSSC